MNKPEILSSLTDEQYRLARTHLANTWTTKDATGVKLFKQAHIHMNAWALRVRIIASEFRVSEDLVLALMAFAKAVDHNNMQARVNLSRGNIWKAFECAGIDLKTPLASQSEEGRGIIRRIVLRAAYEAAICDLETKRKTGHQFQSGFYRQVAAAVFDTCCDALEHYAASKEQDAAEQATLDTLRRVNGGWVDNVAAPRLHVLSAPMGSGKTTFAKAFMMAMVGVSERNPQAPYGVALLVDQIVKADEVYRELKEHLPGKVAIWTTDHDIDCTEPKRVAEPAVRHHKDDLRNYPIAIATHALFRDESETVRIVVRDGKEQDRALIFVDEQMAEVKAYDVRLSNAEKIREQMEDERDQIGAERMQVLLQFMRDKAKKGASLEKPRDEPEDWKVANELGWFATPEAKHYALAKRWSMIDEVFGFARSVVADYAFIARDNSGEAGTHFVGYEPQHTIVPGMVLLDATADIDGVTPLCLWRKRVDVPHGRYDKLSVVFVPSCTKSRNLKRHFSKAANRESYAEWMQTVIRQEIAPGQRGLVVCKMALVNGKDIPGPHPKSPADDPYGWNFEDRHLGVTYWNGPGLGSNAWKEAEVVFLFEENFFPRQINIAQTQGHQLAPTSDGVLFEMDAINSKSIEVDGIGEGGILRWQKQMALRGKGRIFDEQGVCGEQKVVIAAGPGGLERFCLNKDQMFPRASLRVKGFTDAPWKLSERERLLVSLSDPTLPDEVPATRIGELMGMAWRSVSIDMKGDTEVMLKAIGWTYEKRLGRSGSLFRRISSATPAET